MMLQIRPEPGGASPPPSQSPSPFTALPGYRPIRPLHSRGLPRELLTVREGPGGFQRLCAVRVAPTNDAAARHALTKEAEALARIHHPSALPAYDFIQANGWMALVLAFDGSLTLDMLFEKHLGRLELQAAQYVAHAIFDVLAHAHGKMGIAGGPLVHGDMHPANVLVRSTGHVLLRGFRGVGAASADSSRLLAGADLTVYSAPELARGAAVCPVTDVYGAAAIVWHLLAGRPPRCGEPLSLARVRPDVPREIASVLDVCLCPAPRDRLLRAATVAATLRKSLDLHCGRDSLERLHRSVLRSLPPAMRELYSGTPPQWGIESDIETERFRRSPDDGDEPAIELAGRGGPRQPSDTFVDDESPASWLPKPIPSADFSTIPPPAFAPPPAPHFEIADLQPHSHPPVAADAVPSSIRSQGRSILWRGAIAAALTLLVAGSWLIGRYMVGPAWSSRRAERPTRSANVSAGPGEAREDSARRPSEPPKASAAAYSGNADAPTPPALSAEVLFHQTRLQVEGPPEGIVFINGVPSGRTGERFLTRRCGLRFIRIGSARDPIADRGFRWLTRGRPAKLPCGGAASVTARR